MTPIKYYLGLAETSFKDRYNNHNFLSATNNKKIAQNCLNTFGH